MGRVVSLKECNSLQLLQNSHCALGVFDGYHRGHRYLIDKVVKTAQVQGGPSFIITFTIDPDELFHHDRLKKLMSNSQRIETLAYTQVDYCLPLVFDAEFAAQKPLKFLSSIFEKNYPASLHVGSNFHFGKCAQGNVELLSSWGKERGVAVTAYELDNYQGRPVSSTRIRLLLQEGDIKSANKLLAQGYTIDAVISVWGDDKNGNNYADCYLEQQHHLLPNGWYAIALETSLGSFQTQVQICSELGKKIEEKASHVRYRIILPDSVCLQNREMVHLKFFEMIN